MFSVFEWFVLVFQCDAFVVIVLSVEPRQNQERGLVDCKLIKVVIITNLEQKQKSA